MYRDAGRQPGNVALDWRDTDATGLRLDMWVNDTRMQAVAQGLTAGLAAPGINRWNTAMNLASNSYLNFLQVNMSAHTICSSQQGALGHICIRIPKFS